LIEGLGYVRLEVTDLEKSITFYRDGLRFGFDGRDDEDPRAELHAGDLKLVLCEASARPRAKRGTGVRLSVEVTGVDAYHDALVARGLTPSRPRDKGNSRRFDISDPDGYGWVFVQSLG
jgi:catechol 2,3-dioxygenase-like lactoylglutathione lyase family enzyme